MQRNLKPRVLVVDDDETILAMMGHAFAMCPFDAEFAAMGLEAMSLFFDNLKAGRYFDAFILDCALPHFDGFTMAKIIRLSELTGICPRSKIAFFTAYTQTVERSTLVQESGADLYLRKPQDAGMLPRLITDWLKREVDA
jgi:DNA-binding response OmpR family regulator